MKTNLNIANSLSAEENSYYVSEIEPEYYCFTKTGKLKYIDFYDTHKSRVLNHLHLNDFTLNKVTGFKSMTKTFATLPEDYGISKYVEIEENGDVYVLIHKYVVKEGATEEMLQKEINHAWENNRSWSAEHFMIRVD